jgi:hypothetical protein
MGSISLVSGAVSLRFRFSRSDSLTKHFVQRALLICSLMVLPAFSFAPRASDLNRRVSGTLSERTPARRSFTTYNLLRQSVLVLQSLASHGGTSET